MLELSPKALLSIIEESGVRRDADLFVAFSGGLDSTVLLRLLADALDERRGRLRAIHIHHGLHIDADNWERHCARIAGDLDIEYQSRRVRIAEEPAEGIESAARAARYGALRETLTPGALLLTAHHADDQLETLLLALARGSGVDGLAAMPRAQRFGSGWHLRPMLDFTRATILQWATEHQLTWLDDPANESARFDRNYLRSTVAPALRSRWPSIALAAVRSATHVGEAKQLLDDLAAHDLAAAAVGPCLEVAAVTALSTARRRNLLRYWVRSRGARAPSTKKLYGLEHDMIAAAEDRNPVVVWDGFEMRRHRGLLYCAPERKTGGPSEISWDWASPLPLNGIGTLRAEIAHGRGLALNRIPPMLSVRARVGGESIRLPGQQHHRTLKNLLQEANVLPWWRDDLPLLFAGDALVAVADVWIAAEFAAQPDERGVEIIWEDRPAIEALG